MKVANVVIIVDLLKTPLDLDKIHKKIKNTEFTTLASRWLKMRLMPENLYVAFYRSGKFSVTGIKKIEDIDLIVERILFKLKEIGIEIEKVDIKITTMTFMETMELSRNLDSIISNLDPHKASYEIELFPGLIYKDWKSVFLLFNSGKVIIVGPKSQEEAEMSFKMFKNLIENIK